MIQKISMNSNRGVKFSNMKFIFTTNLYQYNKQYTVKSSIIYEKFNFYFKIV